jgi:hypothetical protein
MVIEHSTCLFHRQFLSSCLKASPINSILADKYLKVKEKHLKSSQKTFEE